MAGILMYESYEVPLVCPACSNVSKRTVGWLETNQDYTCDRCGAETRVDPSYVERAIHSIEEDVGRIRQAEETHHLDPLLVEDEDVLLEEEAEIQREDERFPAPKP